MIKLQEIDPDWDLAKTHAKATKTGRPISKGICPCCFNFIQRQQGDMGDHVKSLDYLGFGVPLFYTFMKNCLILLVILSCTYSCLSLILAYQHNNQHCSTIQFDKLNTKQVEQHHNFQINDSISNISHYLRLRHNQQIKQKLEKGITPQNNPYYNTQHYPHHLQCFQFFVKISRVQTTLEYQQIAIRLISFICILVVILFNKQRSRSMYNYFDQKYTTLSDYSLILTAQIRFQGYAKSIKDFFTSNAFSNKHYPQEIILIPQFQGIQQKQQQAAKLNKKKGKLFDQQDKLKKEIQQFGKIQHSNKIEQIKKQIVNIDHQLHQNHLQLMEIVNQYKKKIDQDKIETGRAIIILNTEAQKHQIINQFPNALRQVKDTYFGVGNYVTIQQAPQPGQILWQNMDQTPFKKYVSITIGFFLSFAFIAVITMIFFFILSFKTQMIQHHIQQNQLQSVHFFSLLIVVLALLIVILLNKFVLVYVLHQITHHQYHETEASLQFSFCLKYVICQFFTTALMTLAVQAIKFNNYFKHHFGVIEEQSIMFLMTTFIVPLIWLINPAQLYIIYRRNKQYGKRCYTQQEANHIMSDFHYDIGKRYAQVLKVMWFTFLYCPLIPVGSLLSIIGLGLYYWVDKYNLLYRSSIKVMVSGKLNYLGSKLIDFCPFFKSLGQLIFDYQLRNTINLLTIIQLVISIIYFLIPWNQILGWLQGDIYELAADKYQDIKDDFDFSYKACHPFYKIIQQAEVTKRNKIILQDAMYINKVNPRLRQSKVAPLTNEALKIIGNMIIQNNNKNEKQGSLNLLASLIGRQLNQKQASKSNQVIDSPTRIVRKTVQSPDRKVSYMNPTLKMI